MLPQRALTALEDWRSEFESDSIIYRRDRSGPRLNKRQVRKTCLQIAGQLGLEAISFGSCRMVFALDSQRVLKVGFSRYGMNANRLEAEASKLLPVSLHASVYDVAPDGLWLVQERVDCTEQPDMRSSEPRRLRSALRKAYGHYINDLHFNNVGRRADGSLVVCDLETFRPRPAANLHRYLKDGWMP